MLYSTLLEQSLADTLKLRQSTWLARVQPLEIATFQYFQIIA